MNKKDIITPNKKYEEDQYFKILKQGQKENPNHIYVWFENNHGDVERMWINKIDGSNKSGKGVLLNKPSSLTELNYGDLVEYLMDEDQVIYATSIKKGPHCMCCGEFIEDEDNALHISDKDKMN